MHPVFETAPATPGISIRFATKTTWEAIRDNLSASEKNFALANGFAAKPGKCLILPAADVADMAKQAMLVKPDAPAKAAVNETAPAEPPKT